MGSLMADICLELKAYATKSTVERFVDEASKINDLQDRMAKLEDSLRCLEDERRKIEAFKRELPLCMQLITDVIDMLNEELNQWRRMKSSRMEFMALKKNEEKVKKFEDVDDCEEEKKIWSSALQLWSGSSCETKTNDDIKIHEHEKVEHSLLESKSLNGCGAFVPFKVPAAVVVAGKDDEKEIVSVSELSLVSPVGNIDSKIVAVGEDHRSCGMNSVNARLKVDASLPRPAMTGAHLGLQAQQQTSRKARRCWSPELHRRFVVALQQLGGAQVATPKQIREMMKVDGLTNDEVKSHLQKYRLHTRRAPNSSASVTHSVPMIGGLWVPQESYTTSTSQQSVTGLPQSPLQLSGSSRVISTAAGDSYEE